MLPLALQTGLSVNEFWGMTIGELYMHFEAHRESEERRAKELLISNYNLAQVISTMVLRGLNGKQPPSISEFYPNEFPDPNEELKIAMMKEKMIDFAIQANKKRGK